MNSLTLSDYFIIFIAITFIFCGGYLIGINRDKLFPKEEDKTLEELDIELEDALELENYEEATRITKQIEKKKNDQHNH
jgi:hypothetical protein